MSTKQCRKCGEIKPIEQFPTYDNGRGEGRRHECQQCCTARSLAIYRRKHPPRAPQTEKRCCECGETKPVEDFHLVRRGGSQCRQARCRPCTSAVTKLYRSTPAGKRRKLGAYIQKTFGISLEAYEAICDSQGGVCAICKQKSTRRLVIDHDHATGALRGALCTACNVGIGMFKDDPSRIHDAINYLLKHST